MGDASARRPSTSATRSRWHLTPGAHVLILDDRNGSSDSLRSIVEREGFRVTHTLAAAQALTLILAAPIGAVIADIDLRGDVRDALWLLQRVRTDVRLVHMPVIGVTREGVHQSLYVRAGFSTVLVEPVTRLTLVGVLRSLVAGDRRED